MRILAIETSCDDTSVAVVENGRHVLALQTDTQTFHQNHYGGVVPEVASRTHLTNLPTVLNQVIDQLGGLHHIHAFAATCGPGLLGSLLVGITTAKTLAWATEKPFIGVHHLAGHLASTYLQSDFSPPYLALLVSGGHSLLLSVSTYTEARILGQTCDDAAGEVFDKAARLLGLTGGGAALAALADTLDEHTVNPYDMPIARTQGPLDFSFSGLKTHISRLVQSLDADVFAQNKPAIAAAFQQAVITALWQKTQLALQQTGHRQLAVVGGVSQNQLFRQLLANYQAKNPTIRVQMPAIAYCTDNAAMMASAAYYSPLSMALTVDAFSRGWMPAWI
jgi:N6-L-threonylcarbamoyladenine synthase